MKKFKDLLCLAACVAAVCSCGKDTPGEDGVNKAPTAITLSESSARVAASGGTVTVTVTAPSKPVVKAATDWITVSDAPFNPNSCKMIVNMTVAANPETSERTGTVTFTAGGLSGSFTITQDASEAPVTPVEPGLADIDEALTNPNASKEARNVYSFLLQENGKHMLTGVQSGGTANNNERVEQIFQTTGKHPALAGYDYIFLQYSPTPAGWDWVVNYGDISAAREQWQNNGLVSFMWHWNVPNSKDAWDKGVKEGDFSGYNFYCDKTTFDIKEALKEGTWQHDFILKDIEKVAGYLKLLQKEGIPVLWRPLHEAAGNYTLYGPNGAWFWWGRGGADACKRLWKLLRDKLEGEYGLDNLIWVWTLDATQGAEKDFASWYPGNDQVDIVGVDIYADDTEAKERQYKAAVNLSGGHKMVTVSECGNIPNPEKCIGAEQAWSWFLVWDLDTKYYPLNTQSYWRQIMSSPRTLVRESMPSLK